MHVLVFVQNPFLDYLIGIILTSAFLMVIELLGRFFGLPEHRIFLLNLFFDKRFEPKRFFWLRVFGYVAIFYLIVLFIHFFTDILPPPDPYQIELVEN